MIHKIILSIGLSCFFIISNVEAVDFVPAHQAADQAHFNNPIPAPTTTPSSTNYITPSNPNPVWNTNVNPTFYNSPGMQYTPQYYNTPSTSVSPSLPSSQNVNITPYRPTMQDRNPSSTMYQNPARSSTTQSPFGR